MNTFNNVKLSVYISEFMDNLHDESCLHPRYAEIFRLYTFITFNSTMKSLTKSHTSPLPLYFDSPASLKYISVKEAKIKELFSFLDVNGIGRIDAYEFITPVLLVSSGEMSKFWECVIENFGIEQEGSISSDEFFYFIDSLFRGLSKILVKKDDDPKDFKPRNMRLNCYDISEINKKIFVEETEFVNKEDLKDRVQSMPELVKFMEYVHEKGSEALKKKKAPAFQGRAGFPSRFKR